MKLPPRFVLLLEGNLWAVNQRARIAPNELPHLLNHLMTGNEVGDVFEAYGLRVTIETDTDGAPPDEIIDWVPSSRA